MIYDAIELDEVDCAILTALVENSRISWAALAEEVGMSAPSTTERVRKLESLGVIEGYTARLNADSLGYGLLAFVAVGLSQPKYHSGLLDWVQATPEVQECHVIAGDYDYLLKVRCSDTESLERLLREELRANDGVTGTRSTIVMTTCKETATIPLP